MTSIELIRNFLEQKTDTDPRRVVPEARLDALGIDSLALLELIFEFEDQWNVTVPEDMKTPETVGELIDLVEQIRQPQA